MNKRIFAPLLSALLIMAATVPAFADTGTGSVTVAGPEKTVDIGATINFTNVTLSGQAQSTSGSTTVWTVTDHSGTGTGWALQIAATQLTTTAAVAGESRTIPMTGFKMLVPTPVLDGSGTPEGEIDNTIFSVDGGAALTTGVQTILDANTNEGMGKYIFTPSFTLAVPGTTYAGTYQSVITVDFVASPS